MRRKGLSEATFTRCGHDSADDTVVHETPIIANSSPAVSYADEPMHSSIYIRLTTARERFIPDLFLARFCRLDSNPWGEENFYPSVMYM
ncbi:hypothetical protein ANO14919_102550 [Xylariales sp. No.14919]|nr:hypothetical protein ANO14919_102550 [Xylariales sp. No.14919]